MLKAIVCESTGKKKIDDIIRLNKPNHTDTIVAVYFKS